MRPEDLTHLHLRRWVRSSGLIVHFYYSFSFATSLQFNLSPGRQSMIRQLCVPGVHLHYSRLPFCSYHTINNSCQKRKPLSEFQRVFLYSIPPIPGIKNTPLSCTLPPSLLKVTPVFREMNAAYHPVQ